MAQRIKRVRSTGAELDAAARRGRMETRRDGAREVDYDRDTRVLRITLNTGVMVMIPIDRIPGLERADSDDLVDVRLSPMKTSISFESLDADYAVHGLIRNVLGLNEQQRAAGTVTSPAKAAAAAANGARGGRPRNEALVHDRTQKQQRKAAKSKPERKKVAA